MFKFEFIQYSLVGNFSSYLFLFTGQRDVCDSGCWHVSVSCIHAVHSCIVFIPAISTTKEIQDKLQPALSSTSEVTGEYYPEWKIMLTLWKEHRLHRYSHHISMIQLVYLAIASFVLTHTANHIKNMINIQQHSEIHSITYGLNHTAVCDSM